MRKNEGTNAKTVTKKKPQEIKEKGCNNNKMRPLRTDLGYKT